MTKKVNDKMKYYELGREVPIEAQKSITAGRLKGFTDINPMWRIKKLTEMFGTVGIGWYYEIIDNSSINVTNEEGIASIIINLYIKDDNGEWSKPIQGIGGSKFITKERNGLYISDEAYKMALTDALSVACKALGIGADIYWQGDKSKYDKVTEENNNESNNTENIKDLIAEINKQAKELAKTNVDEMRKVLIEVHGSTNYTKLTDINKANEILERFKGIK